MFFVRRTKQEKAYRVMAHVRAEEFASRYFAWAPQWLRKRVRAAHMEALGRVREPPMIVLW